ncbi:hypothetical protein BJX63DRAFT_37379 [Aspergillus granulosus]|uniref:Secreted protein n=1 Tax=Aspergillus granulosus TaxID=176169 RepID=A0ABR4GYZ1_9EURO
MSSRRSQFLFFFVLIFGEILIFHRFDCLCDSPIALWSGGALSLGLWCQTVDFFSLSSPFTHLAFVLYQSCKSYPDFCYVCSYAMISYQTTDSALCLNT